MEITDLGRKGLITTQWGDRKERTYRNNLGRDRQTNSGKERKEHIEIEIIQGGIDKQSQERKGK